MTKPTSVAAIRQAGVHLQNHDAGSALRELEAAIAADPTFQPLRAFAGLAACQAGRLDEGIVHLREALAMAADDRASRTNLLMALLELGHREEAEAVAATIDLVDPRAARGVAHLHQAAGRNDAAAIAYERVVAAFPQDFESWNNLANCRAAVGETDAAIAAFRRAMALSPKSAEPALNASFVLAAAGREDENRALLREATARIADNAALYCELGVAETAAREFDRAERAFRNAIARDPGFVPAYFQLGMLFDRLNELEPLRSLIAFAERNRLREPEIDFLRAWELKRQGAFAEALALVESSPADVSQVRRDQLLGELYDRLGDPERAFAAFTRMNEAAVAETSAAIREDAGLYLDQVRASTALMTPAQVAAWAPPVAAAEPASPIFIVGFPRSGTTLLDTLLMGVPDVHVLEEQAMMRIVEIEMGDVARLPTFDEAEIERLRDLYFDSLERISPPPPRAMIIDKHPLHMVRMPLIHRLFPDAKIVFAERHPCDVLLSCFVSSFQPNRGMVHFQTLAGAATLYDAAFEGWTAARQCLPLDVHFVRYERMVQDLESEMRALLAFLDLPWDDRAIDHRASAAKRGHISTASYAQVTEPIYQRSRGRWERYREQLAPVLPILAPWAERMGYEV